MTEIYVGGDATRVMRAEEILKLAEALLSEAFCGYPENTSESEGLIEIAFLLRDNVFAMGH